MLYQSDSVTHWPWQELGFTVEIQSCSDISPKCRDMITENFQPCHLFGDMHDQVAQKPCLWHSSSGPGCSASGGQNIDLACFGTVCAPYSVQRAKRFACGSVKQHSAHTLTADVSVCWLRDLAPPAAIAENVEGWDMREDTDDQQTPLQKLLATNCSCRISSYLSQPHLINPIQ